MTGIWSALTCCFPGKRARAESTTGDEEDPLLPSSPLAHPSNSNSAQNGGKPQSIVSYEPALPPAPGYGAVGQGHALTEEGRLRVRSIASAVENRMISINNPTGLSHNQYNSRRVTPSGNEPDSEQDPEEVLVEDQDRTESRAMEREEREPVGGLTSVGLESVQTPLIVAPPPASSSSPPNGHAQQQARGRSATRSRSSTSSSSQLNQGQGQGQGGQGGDVRRVNLNLGGMWERERERGRGREKEKEKESGNGSGKAVGLERVGSGRGSVRSSVQKVSEDGQAGSQAQVTTPSVSGSISTSTTAVQPKAPRTDGETISSSDNPAPAAETPATSTTIAMEEPSEAVEATGAGGASATGNEGGGGKGGRGKKKKGRGRGRGGRGKR